MEDFKIVQQTGDPVADVGRSRPASLPRGAGESHRGTDHGRPLDGRCSPTRTTRSRKGEVEGDLRRGTYVAREEREATFGGYYARWRRVRRVSESRLYTDDNRAARHVLPFWRHWAIPTALLRWSILDGGRLVR